MPDYKWVIEKCKRLSRLRDKTIRFVFAFLVGMQAYGEVKHGEMSFREGSDAWTTEEIQWVQEVLKGNKEIAQQRIQGKLASVSRDHAQGGLKPKWSLEASANLFPQAKDATLSGSNSLPGQTWSDLDQSVKLSQMLPTGGEAAAQLSNGNLLPKGGDWQDTQSVSLGLRQPLLKGFGASSPERYALAQSKIEEAIARSDLKAKLLEIIAEARSQFWSVALKKFQLQALVADSMYWHQALQTAEARNRLGDMAEDEFLGFKIDALSSRQSLLEGRRQFNQAMAKMLLLLHPESKLHLELTHSDALQSMDSLSQALGLKWELNLESIPKVLEVRPGDLERLQPALLRMAHLQERSQLALAKSRRDRLPDLDLVVDWTKPVGGDASTRLGAQFTWELPSLDANKSMRQALLQMESQKLDSLQTRRELENSLIQLRDQFQTQTTGFLLSREKVGLERTRSRIAQRRYELGDLTFTDLELTARNRLKAEQDVATDYVALRLLVVEMERWSGISLAQTGVRLEGESW